MFFIEELNAKLVEENGFRFVKRHLMLLEIRNGFGLIPLELNHTYIVFIIRNKSSDKEPTPFNLELTGAARLYRVATEGSEVERHVRHRRPH